MSLHKAFYDMPSDHERGPPMPSDGMLPEHWRRSYQRDYRSSIKYHVFISVVSPGETVIPLKGIAIALGLEIIIRLVTFSSAPMSCQTLPRVLHKYST